MTETTEQRRTFRAELRKVARYLSRHENAILIGILIVLVAALAFVTRGKTVAPENIRNVLEQSSIRGIVSVGQTFVVLTGGIDLTVGGAAIMCTVLGARLLTLDPAQQLLSHALPVGLGLLIMLLTGVGIGTVNGLSVSRLRMAPLLVTLAVWLMTQGLAYLISGGLPPIYGLPESLYFFGNFEIAGLSILVIVFIVVASIGYFVLNYTVFGRSVYVVGGNPVSAWLSGIRTPTILLAVYVISGFLAGVSSIGLMSRSMTGSLQIITALELDSIASVFIGGISMYGGRGNLIGPVIGAIIIGVVNNALNVIGVEPGLHDLVRGGLIFGAVAASALRGR
jgi:ribose/xylose/arabinose/galactoside ABC-type transport system permease subunit